MVNIPKKEKYKTTCRVAYIHHHCRAQLNKAELYSPSSSCHSLAVSVSVSLNRAARNVRKTAKRGRFTWGEEEEEEEEVELSQDPLEVLGRDIMLMILKNLDARSVALFPLVSGAWHGVASSDSIWSAKVKFLLSFLTLWLVICIWTWD